MTIVISSRCHVCFENMKTDSNKSSVEGMKTFHLSVTTKVCEEVERTFTGFRSFAAAAPPRRNLRQQLLSEQPPNSSTEPHGSSH